jgi:hypothetical protein
MTTMALQAFPGFVDKCQHVCSVIHIDSIICTAHLIGVCGSSFISDNLTYKKSLQAFRNYYVNKYVNYYAYEIPY